MLLLRKFNQLHNNVFSLCYCYESLMNFFFVVNTDWSVLAIERLFDILEKVMEFPVLEIVFMSNCIKESKLS